MLMHKEACFCKGVRRKAAGWLPQFRFLAGFGSSIIRRRHLRPVRYSLGVAPSMARKTR